jgi:small subunit ribosomal protein S7
MNPVQALVKAIENAAPREETTRIRQGGIIAHRAVDVSPARRADISLSFITHGAAQRAFNKKQPMAAALAEEILSAMNYDTKTYSISKREELERVAQSAR